MSFYTNNQTNSIRSTRIASININGFRNNFSSTILLMNSFNIDILAVQETLLPPGCSTHPITPLIVMESRQPLSRNHNRPRAGVAIIRNPQIPAEQFTPILASDNGEYCWIKYKNTLIASFYLYPGISKSDFSEILQSYFKIPAKHRSNSSVIILGDLNTRLGNLFGDTYESTWKRNILNSFINSINLQFYFPRNLPKFTNHTGLGKSIVDYILASPNLHNPQTYLKVDNEPSFHSSHRLISVDVLLGGTRNRNTAANYCPTHKIRLGKLDEAEYHNNYINTFSEISINLFDKVHSTLLPILNNSTQFSNAEARSWIDQANTAITTAITSTATRVLGTHGRRRFKDEFWDEELQQLHFNRLYFFRQLSFHHTNSPHFTAIKKQHTEADRLFKRAIRLKKRNSFLAWTSKLHQSDDSTLIKTISSVVRARGKRLTISTLGEDDLPTARAYWKSIATDLEDADETEKMPLPPSTIPYLHNNPSFYPTRLDILDAINQTPLNKAPGPDNISNNLLRPISKLLCNILLPLFTAIAISGETPSDWNLFSVILIWKAKGAPDDPAKHRPIALLQVLRKIFERLITKPLNTEATPLDFVQGGFKKGCSTMDQVLAFNTNIQYCSTNNNHTHAIALLDITAAFPSIRRDILWVKLQNSGVSTCLINILKSLFNNLLASIKINQHSGSPFWLEIGIPQGSVLCPLLFNYFLNDLPGEARQQLSPLTEHLILFADDIGIVTRNLHTLRKVLKICENHSIRNKYKFDPSKSELILHPSTPANLPLPVTLYNQPLARATHVKYLGVWFNYYGIDHKFHISKRTQVAHMKLQELVSIGLRGNSFSELSILKIYKSLIRPILEYGLAIDLFPKEAITAISKFQFRFLRTAFSLQPSTSQRAMLLLTGLEPPHIRNGILAFKSWSRWMDRQNNPKFCSSYALNLSYRLLVPPFKIQSSLLLRKIEKIKQDNPLLTRFKIITTRIPNIPSNFLSDFTSKAFINLHTTTQELAAAISPSTKPSNLLYGTEPLVSDAGRRRLTLWRLGMIPGHPHQNCQDCLLDSHETPANRKHVILCTNANFIINRELIRIGHPGLRLSSNPNVNSLDLLIDALPKIPQLPWDLSNADQDLLDKIALWSLAEYVINKICTSCLGWNNPNSRPN